MEPLAQRLRPRSLEEVCGQQHLLGPGRVFRRTMDAARATGRIPNMIFYGPSGVGKTTVAGIIAQNSGMRLQAQRHHRLHRRHQGGSGGGGDAAGVRRAAAVSG